MLSCSLAEAILLEIRSFASKQLKIERVSNKKIGNAWVRLSEHQDYTDDWTYLRLKILIHCSFDGVKQRWEDDQLCVPYTLFGHHSEYGCKHKYPHNKQRTNHAYTMATHEFFGAMDVNIPDYVPCYEQYPFFKTLCYYFVYAHLKSYPIKDEQFENKNTLVALYYCLCVILFREKKYQLCKQVCLPLIGLDSPNFDFWQLYSLYGSASIECDNNVHQLAKAAHYINIAITSVKNMLWQFELAKQAKERIEKEKIEKEAKEEKEELEERGKVARRKRSKNEQDAELSLLHFLLSKLFCDKFNKYDKSSEYGTLACQENPNNCRSHYYLGKSLFYLGKEKDSKIEFQKAIWLNDDKHWLNAYNNTKFDWCFHPWNQRLDEEQKQFAMLVYMYNNNDTVASKTNLLAKENVFVCLLIVLYTVGSIKVELIYQV